MRSEYHYFVFDCHYYLENWRPLAEGEVYLVGGAFHPVAGRYSLPCGEGEFTVHSKRGKGWLTMWTRSAGFSYDHPLVAVQNVDTRFDYGWYSHIKCCVHSTDLVIDPIDVPDIGIDRIGAFTGRSIQANWIVDQLKELEAVAASVRVIPVHKARFVDLQVDEASLNQLYELKATPKTVLRAHDFSKGDILRGQFVNSGWGIGRFQKRLFSVFCGG